MRLERTALRSKVGQRMFALFVMCALIPILVLAFLSYYQVAKQLTNDSQRHLMQLSKAQGMAIVERLQMLDAELQLAGPRLTTPGVALAGNELRNHFVKIDILEIPARDDLLAQLSSAQREHLLNAKAVLRVQPCSTSAQNCVSLLRLIDSKSPDSRLVVGEINFNYLWQADDLPPGVDQCTFDSQSTPLVCPSKHPSALADSIRHAGQSSGFLLWQGTKEQYDVAYWTLMLKPQFQAGVWRIAVRQDHEQVLAPLRNFRQTFPPIVLLALWFVILASLKQIRRTLVPLEKLKEGTQQIADQNFSSRVEVQSSDEFEELAQSFNAMTARLGRQFQALETIHKIDQAILTSLNREGIMDAMLRQLPQLLPFDCIGITLFQEQGEVSAVTRFAAGSVFGDKNGKVLNTQTSAADADLLGEHTEILTIADGQETPEFVAPLRKSGLATFFIAPVFLDQRLFAALVCANWHSPTNSSEDLHRMRQLADQLAVAFSNVELIEALEQLHWGTLTALARAIDAKSAWTAGHSERVTKLSLRIGRAMGLSAKDLQIMHRGGLLHDIGKIGTPPEVLDKPGKLDPEELKVMQDHVRIGVRILEPIRGSAEALPIVAQHHERFDGLGYPLGLAGEQISLHARVFAVADCYDAMTSDRPYRKGLPQGKVVETIKQGSGKQFDPAVVEAFLRLRAEEEITAAEGDTNGKSFQKPMSSPGEEFSCRG